MLNAKVVLGAGLALGTGAATAATGELDWLAGHWCGGRAERTINEVWLPEAGGALLGMSRTVRGGKMESFEFMRLVPEGKDVGFHVQPNGLPATVFAITGRGEGSLVFENPAHDFPNRIEYRRDGDGLRATIAGPGRDGKKLEILFEYSRCDG